MADVRRALGAAVVLLAALTDCSDVADDELSADEVCDNQPESPFLTVEAVSDERGAGLAWSDVTMGRFQELHLVQGRDGPVADQAGGGGAGERVSALAGLTAAAAPPSGSLMSNAWFCRPTEAAGARHCRDVPARLTLRPPPELRAWKVRLS